MIERSLKRARESKPKAMILRFKSLPKKSSGFLCVLSFNLCAFALNVDAFNGLQTIRSVRMPLNRLRPDNMSRKLTSKFPAFNKVFFGRGETQRQTRNRELESQPL